MQLCSACGLALLLGFGGLGCHVQSGAIHRVEDGDSLVQIAHVYGVEVREILEANNVPNALALRPGQKLLIPGASASKRVAKGNWNFEDVSETDLSEEPTEKTPPVPPPEKKSRVVQPAPSKPKGGAPQKEEAFAWPAEGKILSAYGMRNTKMHNGIDIRMSPGGDVRSTASGSVVYQGKGIEGYGDLVIVRHGDSFFSVYAYLGEIVAQKGTRLRRGDVVGRASRDPARSFIHFEIRKGKRAYDPLKLLSKKSG